MANSVVNLKPPILEGLVGLERAGTIEVPVVGLVLFVASAIPKRFRCNRTIMVSFKHAENYIKPELETLISRLKNGDQDAEYECVIFVLAESFGIWHGRARAKICRNLKHHPPDEMLRFKLVERIIWRLKTGNFSEQFKDQLKMAIRFSPNKMLETAHQLRDAEKEYVRRYAAYVCRAIDNL